MQVKTEEKWEKGNESQKKKKKNAFKNHIYEPRMYLYKIIYVRIYKKLRFHFLIKNLRIGQV